MTDAEIQHLSRRPFTCVACRESIEGLPYYTATDGPLCKRDYWTIVRARVDEAEKSAKSLRTKGEGDA